MLKFKVQTEKYAQFKQPGLNNMGNTCFMNSCLQILLHTYEFIEVINSEKIYRLARTKMAEHEIFKEWNALTYEMYTTNEPAITPVSFVQAIHNVAVKNKREIFAGWAQNDVSEFLLFLLESIHQVICRPIKMKVNGIEVTNIDKIAMSSYLMLQRIYTKEYSEIMEIFYGTYVSTIYSANGKKLHSIVPEHYFMVDLPIPFKENGIITLYDCLDAFVSNEYLTGENMWMNEKTNKKEEVIKKISFWSFPNVLTIALKRFSPDGLYKKNDIVHFPINHLNLANYIEGYNQHSYLYELYGICNHIGNVNGGHYTAFVKDINGKWMHYNDSYVVPIPEEELQNMITPMAYCLFYRKKNNFI
jgi:ubiquitin carboxyl-terminal hydrolase 8